MTNKKTLCNLSTIDLAKTINSMSGKSVQEIVQWLKADADPDPVSNPSHYNQLPWDALDVMTALYGKADAMAFCECNALKYIWRHKQKGGVEDIEKAKEYLDRYISLASDSKTC